MQQESADPKASRFAEPTKFVPVLFICAQIGGLWFVYIFYHCMPMLQHQEHVSRAWAQIISFNCAAIMLVICYVRSIITHPGTIPDREAAGHSLWEYVPQDRGSDPFGVGTTETKRSGERRHCKWCAKYKPDRCHHCRVCRMCILKMDHHCPWIYNCVGFYNHKFFFLLLFYTVIATNIIAWTMVESVRQNVDPETPFVRMFTLLFAQTLATFLSVLVTLFFGFHIWLTFKSMTTIEFCEKSLKRVGYDTFAYDRGFPGNLRGVLGDNPLLWLLPVSTPCGDGLTYTYSEETPLRLSKDMETGRDLRKKTHEQMGQKPKRKKHAGTGECADVSGQDSESSIEHYGAAQDLALPLHKGKEISGLGGSS